MNMEVGTIVRNKNNDYVGVVALDVMACCSASEEPVVYDGTDAFIGTDRSDLEEIGTYDPEVADPEKCGAGHGEKTCRYLTFSEDGFTCGRFSVLRNAIIGSSTEAQGVPKSLYPVCQEEIQASIESEG
jgi:hypothetical protein